MKKILISDPIDEVCKELLEAAGHEVNYSTSNSKEFLPEKINSYNALIVRSSTFVSSELISKMDSMEVIGRAGAGVDNIDVPAATRQGILVMNTPGGNTISAAEHTIALLLSICRKIPQADYSLKNEEWIRGKFKGTELLGKTLGLIGLGKIGREVAMRAKAFGMKIISYDPIMSADAVSRLGLQLVELEKIWELSDFISIHTPLNENTKNLISYKELLLCKKGVGIINCARGGLINESDLLRALNEGLVSAAGLDVFEKEPPDFSNKLLKHPSVICTPHLGASTAEAQKKVAAQIAEQLISFFKDGSISGAVNASALKDGVPEKLLSFVKLSEVIGRLLSQLRKGSLKKLMINLNGDELQASGQLLSTSLLKGFLDEQLDSPINMINAQVIADEMGISVEQTYSRDQTDFLNFINASSNSETENLELAGTVFGKNELRIVRFNKYQVEFKPSGNLLIYKNVDTPGMLAAVSKILSDANINIASLTLGRNTDKNEALAIVTLDSPVGKSLRNSILGIKGIKEVYTVRMDF